MKIYTVLDVNDVQQFVGHVCLFGDCVSDIENCTRFGILAEVDVDPTDSHPYAKYGKGQDEFYSLVKPCPEWDSFLEEVRDSTPLKKRLAAEYQYYLAEKV